MACQFHRPASAGRRQDRRRSNRSRSGNSSAVGSLSCYLLSGKDDDTDVLLAEVAQKTRDITSLSEKKQITSDQQAQMARQKAQEKKFEQAEEKMKEAKEKGHTSDILDGVKCAFAWIAAAMAIVVAAVMIASGAGIAVGVLLISAAICATAIAVDSTVSVSTHKGGIAGHIAKEAGANDDEAGKADMGFQISVSALGAIFSIGAGVAGIAAAGRAALSAGFSAVRAGEEAGTGTTELAMSGAQVAADANGAAVETSVQTGAASGGAVGSAASEASPAQTLKQVFDVMKSTFMATLREQADKIGQTAKIVRAGSGVSDGVSQAGSSATDAAKGGIDYEAAQLRAGAKDLQGDGKAYEGQIQLMDKMIDMALDLLMKAGDRYAGVLESIADAMKDRGDTVSRVRFGG